MFGERVLGAIFQFTPLREGRRLVRKCSAACHVFQITPLREGRHQQICREHVRIPISIHAPACGATEWEGICLITLVHFNSRPCVRGDGSMAQKNATPSKFQFSPLREGRQTTSNVCLHRKLFQFTPLREGRHGSRNRSIYPRIFQFTPLREGRLLRIALQDRLHDISIHAPA